MYYPRSGKHLSTSSPSTPPSPFYSPRPDLTTTTRQAAIDAAGLLSSSPACYPHVPAGPPCLMPISTPLAPSHPSFIKMEDRKRSAGEDLAPPTKRQAVNGKASADADMPWSSDLEVCRSRYGFTSPFHQPRPRPIQSSSSVPDFRSSHIMYLEVYDLSGRC